MTKAPAPVPSKSKPPVLPQSEVAELATRARAAWDSGELVQTVDTLGGLWEFETVRDSATRLMIRRYGPADAITLFRELTASGQVGQVELNTDNAATILAATINAVSDPAKP